MIHNNRDSHSPRRIEDARARRQSPPVRVSAAINTDTARLQQMECELRTTSTALAEARAQVSRLEARETQAQHLAMHDALTGLPNRRYFQQRLDRALSPPNTAREPVAVFYIDLNGFKAINDTHGHHTGDQVLQIVGARLKNSMRAEDIVCRLGGDEFGCLLMGLASRRRVSHVATKVFNVLAAPVRAGSFELSVPPSIGISLAPVDGTSSEELLHRADEAMYHAKHYQTRYTFFRKAMPSGMAVRDPLTAAT